MSYEDLERRFDGPIPTHLLLGKTEAELMADHHKAMVRFHRVRVTDYAEALAKLDPADISFAIWDKSLRESLTFHREQMAVHERALGAA